MCVRSAVHVPIAPGGLAVDLKWLDRCGPRLLCLFSRVIGLVWRKVRSPAGTAAGAFLTLSACTILGPLEERAEQANLASATYSSAAVLYNVLRASEAEPLDFVSLTGVTGHEGSTIGIGLPTIIVGPGRTSAQNLFLFGPNSVGGSASNDFNISVVDDPASQAALLKPVDLATMGFFLNQGYNADHVFFLFLSRIVTVDSKSGQVVQSLSNEPYGYMEQKDGCRTVNDYGLNCRWIGGFYTRLIDFIKAGLSIEVEPSFVPTQGGSGTARFCFDLGKIAPGYQLNGPEREDAPACTPALLPDNSPVGQAQTVSGSIQKQTAQHHGADNFSVTAKVVPPMKDKTSASRLAFSDPLHPGQVVYVYTRSVYGAYRFLGEVQKLSKSGSFSELPVSDHLYRVATNTIGTRTLNLTHDHLGCWASVDYEANHWCVPKDAITTKRTFQILSQLFRLFASPSNQPVTPTVRAIQ